MSMADERALQYARTKRLAVAGGRAMLVRHIVFALVSLAGSALLLRALGPEKWASYSVAYFLVVCFDNALGANFLGGLVRGAASPAPEERGAAVALMHLVGLGSLLFFTAISLPAAALYGRGELAGCLLAVGVCVWVYAFRATSVAVLERDLRYRTVAAAELTDQLTFYAVALGLLAAGLGLTGVVIGLAVRGVVAALLLRRSEPVPLLGRLDPVRMKALLAFGAPTLGSAFLILLTGLVPAFVLGGGNAKELGYVMTAGTVVGYAATAQVILQRVGFPSFASLARDAPRFAQAVGRTLRLSDTLVLSTLVPLGGLAPVWLPVLLGAVWEDAAPVIIVMAAGFAFNGVIAIGTAALQSLGSPGATLRVHAVATVAYLVLALILARESQLLGVPFAYAVSRLVGAGAVIGYLRREGVLPAPPRELAALAGAAMAMAAVGTLLWNGSTVWGVLLLVFLAPAWLSLRRADLVVLRSALSRSGRAPAEPVAAR